MPSIFPCPNPACTHTFSPKSVQGASSLVCPKCGTVFRFSSASVQPSAHFDFDSTSEMETPRSRRTSRRRGPNLIGWIFTLLMGILVPALAVWGGMWVVYLLKKEAPPEDAGPATEVYNARFNWPGKPWTRERDIERRFHVHIGMKSSQNNNHMALLFKDYKDRLPSDAEMVDEAVGKLRSFFRGLEWELQSKDGQTRLAGRAAQLLLFQGDDTDHVTMNGECRLLAFHGFGYWFFTWAPLGELEREGDSIRAEWARLRKGLSLQDSRPGWKEKPREALVVSGKKANYRLAYLKALWTRQTADDDDPQIDLLLRGQEPDPERRPLASRDATVQVLVLPPQADLHSATAAALDHVKQREKKLYERIVWEPVRDKNGEIDRDAPIGAEAGHLTKLQAKCTEDLERFFSIAVVNRPDGVVVLVGDCLWERRDFWDQEFAALFKSFKAR